MIRMTWIRLGVLQTELQSHYVWSYLPECSVAWCALEGCTCTSIMWLGASRALQLGQAGPPLPMAVSIWENGVGRKAEVPFPLVWVPFPLVHTFPSCTEQQNALKCVFPDHTRDCSGGGQADLYHTYYIIWPLVMGSDIDGFKRQIHGG